MRKRNYKFYLRKSHRYLGIVIGIQFLLWTLGGLFFSWTNIEEIRGDNLRVVKPGMDLDRPFVPLNDVIGKVQGMRDPVAIRGLRLIEILDQPCFQLEVENQNKELRLVVIDAVSGKERPLISGEEAKLIAARSLVDPPAVRQAVFLTGENVGPHHEYREKPLPAWAVTFENGLTVYLSGQSGEIGALRTGQWRVFDFLWMLHTMDFQGRDNINNYLLRGFSILGFTTIISGFLLFFVSSKFFRRRIKGK